ncbi:hypothetical protein FHK02_3306 [Spirosoma sp. LMG 31448]|nr:hypothetical protein [Spirosoma utsteinense]
MEQPVLAGKDSGKGRTEKGRTREGVYIIPLFSVLPFANQLFFRLSAHFKHHSAQGWDV